MKTSANISEKLCVALAGLAVAIALAGCRSKPGSIENSRNATRPRAAASNMSDSRRLSNGANKLLEAMTKPTQPLHLSFKGQQNINDKYPQDKTQAPQVGPVTMEADFSPDESDIVETRGQTRTEAKAKKGDAMNLAMANLALIGVMTDVNFNIALGASVASSPSNEMVGTRMADKYTYDTTLANPTQKLGLDAARAMFTSIKESKGTVWIAKDSGEMIKFNVDTDYLDKNGHAWKEHYEGEVTPK